MDTDTYTPQQMYILSVESRTLSAISIACCAVDIATFLISSRFQKPINRLIFFAILGNIMFNIASFIFTSGPEAGIHSRLCLSQAFIVQAFLMPDCLFNLSLAINAYLAVFKHYGAERLRILEPYYLGINYGVPLLLALALLVASTKEGDSIYGSGTSHSNRQFLLPCD